MSISRRVFMKSGGLALFSFGLDPLFLARAAFASYRPLPPIAALSRPVLVCLFQRGAVDGLNMVVPHGESLYYRERPRIAVPASDVVDLDGHFGLHPQLAALKRLWDNKSLGVIHAVGSPDSTRSHFDAQDYMESGTPGVKTTGDGWLNRYLQTRHIESETSFRAVALTSQLPRVLQGSAPALAMNQIAQFGLRAANMSDSFEAQYQAAADRVLNGTGREAFDAMKTLKVADPTRYEPDNGADYPRSPFGQALKQIAQLTKADVGLEVALADLGGWDTHVNQGSAQGQLANRLDDFARAIAALAIDLGDRMEDTVVVTMSEFGRAVNENGNGGTDHGHGNAMMIVGGGVRGGHVYGKWPGLAVDQRYDRRDLAVTTDFRDVFGEVVVRHLGVNDPKSIFPGYA